MRRVVALIFLIGCCCGYRPIVMMHGFALSNKVGNHHDWDNIREWVAKAHPGTPTFAIDLFEGLHSTRPLTEQLPLIGKVVVLGGVIIYS